MTGKERKPQAPKVEHLVRTHTDWNDSTSRRDVLYGYSKPYERIPTQPKPVTPDEKATPQVQ